MKHLARVVAAAAVRMGHLPNGLTYYIRRNGRPENRVSLRLAVKAGSVLEEEDQRGLARSREWPVRSLCSGRPCISSTA